MGILAWLVVGLIAGFLASRVSLLVAILVYALIAWVLVKVALLRGDSRRGVRTTTRQFDTRAR